jgi:hypothetical protein
MENPKQALGPNQRDRIHKAMEELATFTKSAPKTKEGQLVFKTSRNKDTILTTAADADANKSETKPEDSNSTSVDHLLNDDAIKVPIIYDGTDPLDNQREQGVIRYINRETSTTLRTFLDNHKLELTPEIYHSLVNKLTRLAHTTAYMRSIYTDDDYYESLQTIIDSTHNVLKEYISDDIPREDLATLAKSLTYKGGSSLAYVETRSYTERLDITNTAEVNIIADRGIEVALDNIDKMRQGALLWYYQRVTGNPKATIPEGMTLEKLLSDKYKTVLNMRRAALYAAAPVGGALVGGLISGGVGAPLLGHLASTAAGGGIGLAGSVWHNNKEESGSKLYDVQLLTALHEFNKKLEEGRGYVSKPKANIILNNLNKLRGQPPSLGTAYSKLSRSDLNYILDQNTMRARDRQKKTRLAVASAAAAFATWYHLPFDIDSATQATSTISPTAEIVPQDIQSSTSTWRDAISQFFTFNGTNGAKFDVPCMYTPLCN